ncbi:MAG: hypothetical protein Q4D32_07910 [Eubacteriales bacterium]|nr:hypothetical protein [Eubacteriales bacterium]
MVRKKKSNDNNTAVYEKSSSKRKPVSESSSQVYDDVIKTECERHTRWLIPLINHYFHTDYSGHAQIELLRNEHHITIHPDLEGRITDAYFRISENGNTQTYHLECQSKGDGTMVIRILEYDFLIALENLTSRLEANQYNVEIRLPETMVMYLRHSNNMPEEFHARICYHDQQINYVAPIVKVQSYELEEMAEAKLYLFIPFYLMRYGDLIRKDQDIDRVEEEVLRVLALLEKLRGNGEISSYEEIELLQFTKNVLGKISEHSKNQERLVAHMKGNIIETDAHRIYAQGEAHGKKQMQELVERKEKALQEAEERIRQLEMQLRQTK